MAPEIDERDDDRGDQTAVEHASGSQDVEEFPWIGRHLAALDDDEEELGADERADDDPDAKVHDPVRVESAGAGAPQRELQP